jgi:hypothetical protein
MPRLEEALERLAGATEQIAEREDGPKPKPKDRDR